MGIDMCFYFLFNEFTQKFIWSFFSKRKQNKKMPIPDSSRRYHIIIDAYNCQPSHLSDRDKVDKVIRDITKLCGMTLLHGPVVLEGVPENPGITGFAIIDFSHISIHTFTNAEELCIDIFSCKPFDYEKVKDYVQKTFALDGKYIKYIEVEYPKESELQGISYSRLNIEKAPSSKILN